MTNKLSKTENACFSLSAQLHVRNTLMIPQQLDIKWWAGGWVQSSSAVWEKSSASECEENQADGDRFQKEEDNYMTSIMGWDVHLV